MAWPPMTESDITAAIAAGELAESSRLDMKERIDNDSSRKGIAKDLASFAVDGGSLLIGVAEDKQRRSFSTSPVPLQDVMERIEQIAANRVDPPLLV